MAKNLIVIAGVGFAVAIVSFGAAAVIGGGPLSDSDFGWFGTCGAATGEVISGNTREIAWQGRDRVTVNIPAVVHYRPDGGNNLTISGPPDVLAHVRLTDGRIDTNCSNLLHGRELEITLPGVPLRRFTLNGSGRLLLENINQSSIDLRLNGSSDVEASGTATDVNVRIAGSGKADLGRLLVQRASVRIMGSGEADIAPEEAADIRIAGSGVIRFMKQPAKLETRIAGSGTIINAPQANAAPTAR